MFGSSPAGVVYSTAVSLEQLASTMFRGALLLGAALATVAAEAADSPSPPHILLIVSDDLVQYAANAALSKRSAAINSRALKLSCG